MNERGPWRSVRKGGRLVVICRHRAAICKRHPNPISMVRISSGRIVACCKADEVVDDSTHQINDQ